jgi:hypothetical protein
MKHACRSLGGVDTYWCEQDGVLMKYDELTDTIVSTWVPKGLIEAFGKIQEDKDNLLNKAVFRSLTQAAALDEIAEVINSGDWDTEMLTHISAVLERTGRNIV